MWTLEVYAEFDLGGKMKADCSATFDATVFPKCKAIFTFEDDSQILIKEYTHVHYIHQYGIHPVLIKKKGEYWRPLFNDSLLSDETFNKPSFHYQLSFMRDLIHGEGNYDVKKDPDGLLIENNIKVQQVIDEVLMKGGIPIHKGMTGSG